MKPNFRVWSAPSRCYVTGVAQGLNFPLIKIRPDGELEIESECGCDLLNPDQYILERAMGRQDRLGREIYEGDIVDVERSDHRFNRYVVCYGPNYRVMDTGWPVEIIGFYFNPPFIKGNGYYSMTDNWKGGKDLDITEIKGNIHENSGLLLER